TVAGGVYAPGHLGELTRQVPFELVDAVLAETLTTQRRLRGLPSRVGGYFVLGLGLFPHLGYPHGWAKLVAARGTAALPDPPSEKALRDLRRRLGPVPLKALFEVLAGPVAQPHTPGVRFGRYRTVAFDGCTSIKVADSDRNRSWLGKLKAALGVTGYPAVELMTLVETGTRALLGAVVGPTATGRAAHPRPRPPLPGPAMLGRADGGSAADASLTGGAAPRPQSLVGLRNTRPPPILARLSDGEHLARLGELTVRIITADVTVT